VATFEEPAGDGFRRGGSDAKGWQVDERGRKYRLSAGCREYERREDRDAAVEETYRLSPTMKAMLSSYETVAGGVFGEVCALAELYYQETAAWFGEQRDWLDRWCSTHFGRRLEPVLRMTLAYELRRRLALEDGGRVGPPAGPWKDWAEERRWESATASVPPGRDSYVRVEAICKAAGVKLGPGVRRMPDAPNVEREANRQRARLAADAPEPVESMKGGRA
jgi:hypothetical protein